MFNFTKEQKIFEIQNISFGGSPGNYPTVLFGGLFFSGEPNFDYGKKHIDIMYYLSKKTSIPAVPDFFIKKMQYVDEIIDFIEKELPNQVFSVDITDPLVKIDVLEKLSNKDLLHRTIYNSIHVGITDDELNALKKYTPEMAIIVAFNPKDTSADGKIEVLENGANLLEIGLLNVADECGIEKILIDTAALAPGQNSGAAIAAIPVIKEEYGLPVGCAIHNVVEKSNWLNDFEHKLSVDAASNLNISLFGGDFALFGPIHNSSYVFPMIAWQDILISEYVENYFGVKPVENHPRRKYYKND
jgi:tetrahydromethanopterin S-methyltransferase subunit H